MSAYPKAILLLGVSFAWWIQPRKRFFNYCIACFFIRYTKKQGSGIHKTHYELPLKPDQLVQVKCGFPLLVYRFTKSCSDKQKQYVACNLPLRYVCIAAMKLV